MGYMDNANTNRLASYITTTGTIAGAHQMAARRSTDGVVEVWLVNGTVPAVVPMRRRGRYVRAMRRLGATWTRVAAYSSGERI